MEYTVKWIERERIIFSFTADGDESSSSDNDRKASAGASSNASSGYGSQNSNSNAVNESLQNVRPGFGKDESCEIPPQPVWPKGHVAAQVEKLQQKVNGDGVSQPKQMQQVAPSINKNKIVPYPPHW